MDEARFIGEAVLEMIKNGVNVNFLSKKSFKGGYAGFYLSNSKTIEIATLDPAFFDVFVHEYSHFLQHHFNPDFYERYGHCKFMQWLTGYQNQATAEEVDQWLKDAIILEHDCEKRALSLIKKYNLPLSVEKYTKSANAYIFSWWFAREFYRMPRNLDCIIDLVPDTIKNVNFYYNRKNYLGEIRERFISAK